MVIFFYYSVAVFDFLSGQIIMRIPRRRTNFLAFSSQNKYLITWETFGGTDDIVKDWWTVLLFAVYVDMLTDFEGEGFAYLVQHGLKIVNWVRIISCMQIINIYHSHLEGKKCFNWETVPKFHLNRWNFVSLLQGIYQGLWLFALVFYVQLTNPRFRYAFYEQPEKWRALVRY